MNYYDMKWHPLSKTDTLTEPLRMREPRRLLVAVDLYEEIVLDEQIDRTYAVAALCPQHTFIVLTKRPERMQKYLNEAYTEAGGIRIADAGSTLFKGMSLTDRRLSAHEHAKLGGQFEWDGPLPNAWHLVSVEDQKSANERIPLLLQTPSAVRGVSCEPLLGPVDPTAIRYETKGSGGPVYIDALHGKFCSVGGSGYPAWAKLDWWVTGGESGPGARPMHPGWVRGLRDQCQAASVPFWGLDQQQFPEVNHA